MKVHSLLLCVATLANLVIAASGAVHRSPREIVPSPDGTHLYVVESTAQRIAVFNPASEKVDRHIDLPGSPGGLAVSQDGKTLYVTRANPEGAVWFVDALSGDIRQTIPVGHTPVSAVLNSEGTTLYVCNQFDHDVSVVDVMAKREVERIEVRREPVAAALTPDGQQLVVANLLPAGAANGPYSAAEVSVIKGAHRSHISLPNGSHSLLGVAVSPDGRFAYVTHILSRYQVPTTQLERGWMNTNALSIIDLVKGTLHNTVLLDNVDRGAANPWGVAVTSDGRLICVTHAGSHELSVILRKDLHEKLDRLQRGEPGSGAAQTFDQVPNDLAFLTGLRRRIPLAARGPRGIAVVGDIAYVTGYFSDSVSLIPLADDNALRPRPVALGELSEPDPIRSGEAYFFDASRCFQHWQSCSSCHPGVRADALNWDLLNDGIGNPKNTKSLLLSHQTPPAMISGIRARAEVAVRAGIRHIQFAVWPEEDAVAVDQFLSSLQPVPSPALEDGALSESAQRGQAVFGEVGCVTCHPPPFYTDLQLHNVHTGIGRELDREWDTPTLVESWRTAPYLHDGRSATMDDLLRKDKHGLRAEIPEEDLSDLIEYVRSL